MGKWNVNVGGYLKICKKYWKEIFVNENLIKRKKMCKENYNNLA